MRVGHAGGLGRQGPGGGVADDGRAGWRGPWARLTGSGGPAPDGTGEGRGEGPVRVMGQAG